LLVGHCLYDLNDPGSCGHSFLFKLKKARMRCVAGFVGILKYAKFSPPDCCTGVVAVAPTASLLRWRWRGGRLGRSAQAAKDLGDHVPNECFVYGAHVKNDEGQMTNDESNPKSECRNPTVVQVQAVIPLVFPVRAWSLRFHSSLEIFSIVS